MVRGIKESKKLTKHVKHVSWKWKCNFDGRKCNSKQK